MLHRAGRLLKLPILVLFGSLVSLIVPVASCAETIDRAPNIVFLLADDLGYGDLGCFGQTKIRTPHLDRLAEEGLRLTQHYSGNAVCAPSRCVLMTGLHPGHAFIRDNRSVPPEGQYPLPTETVTLAKLLRTAGYATGGFGKWGLGPPHGDSTPARQGFDRFFGYLCQAKAHNYYPNYLWSDDTRFELENPEFSPHQRLAAEADPHDADSYAGYIGPQYAPDLITEQALQFVRKHKDVPFFLYYPTTVPHLALQVPEDSLAEYRGEFDEKPYTGDRRYLPHREPRSAYAAMITRMDRDIGRILSLIEELGLDDQTIFIFSSDNGPLFDELGGTDCDFFQSAGMLRGRKASLYEGGVRVPTIVRWKGRIRPGTSDRVSGFEDWLPTILELINDSESIPPKLDGISMAPTLLGQTQTERPYLYREFPGNGGQQSVRVGPWKAIRHNLARGKLGTPETAIKLYNLAQDPSESDDVAPSHPDVVERLSTIMASQHRPSAEFPLPAIDK